MNIKVMVITHSLENDCIQSELYLPVFVGRALTEENNQKYIGDNTGDHISWKNPRYCELTGLYWAWKNLDAEAIGLVHYRRYLGGKHTFLRKRNQIARKDEIQKELERYDLLLPRKRHYYIETIYSHYSHTHYAQDLDLMRVIIQERCPEYISAFDRVLNARSAHMYNMMIAKKALLDSYCSWLFPLLEELENRLDISSYTPYEQRVFGRVAEILVNVWVEKNQIVYGELPVYNLGKTDWKRKILCFLKAKLFHKKYESSF